MDMKFEYFEDVQLLRTTGARVWLAVLMLGLLILPIALPGYALATVSLLATYVIVAIGMNILVGYTGLISLGHAGFFAVGAYGTVMSMRAAPAALEGFIKGLMSPQV